MLWIEVEYRFMILKVRTLNETMSVVANQIPRLLRTNEESVLSLDSIQHELGMAGDELEQAVNDVLDILL